MSKYVMFTEENDWEGETWNFFILLKGNKRSIAKIHKLLSDKDKDNSYRYRLSTQTYSQAEVDKLMKHPSCATYMDDYTIIDKISNSVPNQVDWDEEDPFYKGRLFR